MRGQVSAVNQSYIRWSFYYSPGFIIAIFTLRLDVNFPVCYRTLVPMAAMQAGWMRVEEKREVGEETK